MPRGPWDEFHMSPRSPTEHELHKKASQGDPN
eukprot:CAMPEP_0177393748 /NCGR_PEP_ID=MMETSP0368-20130122/55134_1 /TAXON_ID=447022 ORGANISM="Scrippsiella hangoei-like, Strain SHHI-4" /NCGR_SAMPLE_ID=MMETSP0368 /ASSEMBLY_ACC=CAM_ASM_000363 /LENGTH=31 /DNA_ID= /DNA_START= /DNA_END= /DNA_ORIENTATION=